MIYTVGHLANYLKGKKLAEEEGVPWCKAGREGEYQGGTVWQRRHEAQEYVDRTNPRRAPENAYSVFGVEADWDKDTIADIEVSPARSLLRDAPIVILDP